MHSIAHIINPFKADNASDLFTAQPITFESMLRAKQRASGIVKVELLTAQDPEDRTMLPAGFRATKDLQRSVLDVGTFSTSLKLPLLADLLERLYTESEADYLVYTNVDIGLYPDFYVKLNEFINQGYDAFIINRRRLPSIYNNISDLETIYRKKGKSHPGFDCFVFHRSLYPKLKLGTICIGAPFIEISFSQNLFALSHNFKLFDREQLTFHIGMEIFKKRAPREYYEHNRRQFWQLIKEVDPSPQLDKFPYAHLFWPLRIIRWGLHPCIPIRLVLQLEHKKLKTWF